jgi:YD repeat-containing protein
MSRFHWCRARARATVTAFAILAGIAISPISVADTNSPTIQYVYDELGRVIQITYADGRKSTYEYDEAGNRRAVSHSNDTLPYVYLSEASAVEGKPLNFVIGCSGAAAEPVTVNLETLVLSMDSEEQIADATDFASVAEASVEVACDGTAIFSIETEEDDEDEETESLRLRISSVDDNAASIDEARRERFGIIYDNDGNSSTFHISPADVAEGGKLVFNIYRDGQGADISRVDTVDLETLPGTAQAGMDYVHKSGRLQFEHDEFSKTFEVQTIDDNIFEVGS